MSENEKKLTLDQVRIQELERDLHAVNTLSRNYKIREADQLLLIAYHHAKAGAELASRIAKCGQFLPEDERFIAKAGIDALVTAYSHFDKLIADRGNNTPHEKGTTSN